MRELTRLAELIARSEAETSGPVLVAIDGRSGTGKSTIAGHLAGALDAALVPGDDFFAGGTGTRSLSAETLAEICVDRARLSEVLATLKVNEAARYAPFDWGAFDGSLSSRQALVEPRRVVIAEGVYTGHPDMRNLIDVAVLIRAPDAERERRLMKREGGLGPWERQWHRAEDWYFAHLARPEAFDLVFENT